MVVPAALRELHDRTRPVTLAREHTLPVVDALGSLFVDGALTRGSAVGVSGVGATSLGLALAVGASRAGAWVAVVGLADLGLAAAFEAGISLERLALVEAPSPGRWAEVIAALVDGIDVVIVDGRAPLTASEGRRLAARVRERGSVLIPVTQGSQPTRRRPGAWSVDLTLEVRSGRWEGLGQGHGHLQGRVVRAESGGRGKASRMRSCELWLPSADGSTTVRVEPEREATVVLLRPDKGSPSDGA